MPIRVRGKLQQNRDASPASTRYDVELPEIELDDDFRQVVKKLALYVRLLPPVRVHATLSWPAAGCHMESIC